MSHESEFEIELKHTFIEEVEQLLSDVEGCFLSLEDNADNTITIDKILRIAHNIKGSAKGVGFDQIGDFTHELENFLLSIKHGDIAINSLSVNILLRSKDYIDQAITSLKKDFTSVFTDHKLLNEIINFKALENLHHQTMTPISSQAELEIDGFKIFDEEVSDTPACEPISLKSSDHANVHTNQSQITADESIRVSLQRLEKLIDFVGEMVILQAVINEQLTDTSSTILRKSLRQLNKVSKEIQDISMNMRMVPVKTTFQKMQRIVRDTAQKLNKNVRITLSGEDTELDKTVLEKISDPLVHLVRNAIDHGLEYSEERLNKGKSEVGHILLNAYHASGKLVLEIQDDGQGIDYENIVRIAKEKKLISGTTNLSAKDAMELIFKPGFSTKTQVTDVSGRGVGMDVVKTNIEALGGEIKIESQIGQGTTFRIFLPLTMAIIDGMIVRTGNERYIIPLVHVHETLRANSSNIKSTTGLGKVLMLRGENLPVYGLNELLPLKSHQDHDNVNAEDEEIAIVVRSGSRSFALKVDDVIGQGQVVVKQLGQEVRFIKGISGSTILGDGKPALILEPLDLIKDKNKTRNLRQAV
ncbi:MAG: chemotaxis protein CheA [Oligoflexus sp.]